MSGDTVPAREEIVAILAEVTGRGVDAIGEEIDSLELMRLIYELERRHGLALDLDDDQLLQMSTVTGVVETLRTAGAVDRS